MEEVSGGRWGGGGGELPCPLWAHRRPAPQCVHQPEDPEPHHLGVSLVVPLTTD